MLRTIKYLMFALVMSGFSAMAQTTYSLALGERGMTMVSEVTQFFTGDARKWTEKGVQVYHPKSNRRYAKTIPQMRRLPVGARVKVDASLVKTRAVTLNTPATVADVCGKISVWKCTDRLEVFNKITTGPGTLLSTLTAPAFFPEIPNPPAPKVEPKPQTTSPVSTWERFIYWLSEIIARPRWMWWALWILVASLLTLVILLILASPKPPPNETWVSTRKVWLKDRFGRRTVQEETIVESNDTKRDTIRVERTDTDPTGPLDLGRWSSTQGAIPNIQTRALTIQELWKKVREVDPKGEVNDSEWPDVEVTVAADRSDVLRWNVVDPERDKFARPPSTKTTSNPARGVQTTTYILHYKI